MPSRFTLWRGQRCYAAHLADETAKMTLLLMWMLTLLLLLPAPILSQSQQTIPKRIICSPSSPSLVSTACLIRDDLLTIYKCGGDLHGLTTSSFRVSSYLHHHIYNSLPGSWPAVLKHSLVLTT